MASSSDTDYLPLLGLPVKYGNTLGFLQSMVSTQMNISAIYILFIIIIIGKFIEPDKKPDTPNSFQIVEFSLSSSMLHDTRLGN